MATTFDEKAGSLRIPSLTESLGPAVFTARIEVKDGEATVALSGELDMESARWLSTRLEQVVPRPRSYVFDLAEVTSIDSHGGRVLVERGTGSPVFRSPSPAARRFLCRVGLDRFIEETEINVDLDGEDLFDAYEGL